jgi:hypothetical protein
VSPGNFPSLCLSKFRENCVADVYNLTSVPAFGCVQFLCVLPTIVVTTGPHHAGGGGGVSNRHSTIIRILAGNT